MKPEIRDITAAFLLLTRLPLPADHAHAGARGAAAAWAYPLVGAAIGAVAGSLGWGLLWIGVSAPMVAVFILGFQIAITGGLHEDGLADFADGSGGFSRERRLEIMKDSRIGTYGALALILAILARYFGISALEGAELPLGLAALGAGSRAAMVVVMAGLPNARAGGMSAKAGRPERATAGLAVLIGAALCFIAFGWGALWVLALMALAALAIMALARKSLGGQTGDVLGASQQASEIAGFAVLTAV